MYKSKLNFIDLGFRLDLSLRMTSYQRHSSLTSFRREGSHVRAVALRTRFDPHDLDLESEQKTVATSSKKRQRPALWYLRSIADDKSMQGSGEGG